MRPAISFLKSKLFQLFVKKKFSLLYPDPGIVPQLGYIPRLVPFSSLYNYTECLICVLYACACFYVGGSKSSETNPVPKIRLILNL